MDRNADAPWSKFDPATYVDLNYRTPLEVDLLIVRLMRDHFSGCFAGGVPAAVRGVDVGAGANLYPALSMLPFHGDAKAKDVVVRSTLSQGNGPSVGIDYRLENTPQGWKIYDLNVEGIWLIQNYRNQFAQQIEQGGIDGLIQALNKQNS